MASISLHSSAGRAPTAMLRTGVNRPGTAVGGIGLTPTSLEQIPEGKYTATIYTLIHDSRFQDVIKILDTELMTKKSRPCLSLLAYCYYQIQDYSNAYDCYEQLVDMVPDNPEYKLYYSQSLYKAGQHQAALRVINSIDSPSLTPKLLKLQASIKYELDDLIGCKTIVDQLSKDSPDTMINQGCLLFKEGKFEEACAKYSEAGKILGFVPEISYNIALCYYMERQYVSALKNIADIIERAIRNHPELGIGMATEGMDLRSIGNSQLLHETFVIEAFNLKAAIEYSLKNLEAAKEAMLDMPRREEHELDQVTLHNLALLNMDVDPHGGFEKLAFLLEQNPCPPETFGNILLLYCRYGYYDSAADLLAENMAISSTALSPYLYDFLEATLMKSTAPDEAFKKFDDLANRHIEILRKLTKQVQELRANHDEDGIKLAVSEFDDAVDRYIPILMAQAKIYWDSENYAMVEKIFRKSVEFCNENDTWKLNVAHVLFMQETKYKEAISFYEPLVKKNLDNILDVPAIVLANLCVAYIMTSQNEEAEELMRRIEKEEERIHCEDSGKRSYHLCIVNLVIGTLYCSKGNYEFGISRIMKSLEPFNKKVFGINDCLEPILGIMPNDALPHFTKRW